MRLPSLPRTVTIIFVTLALALCAQAGDKQNLIYNFNRGSGGYAPVGTLLMDSSGNLYGAANLGGNSNLNQCCGTIFEMSPKSGGGWTYSAIYTFTGFGNDSLPNGSLVSDASGNLFGSTTSFGFGEIFELLPGADGWTETVLYTLESSDGVPPSPVVLDAGGNFYGTVT